MLGASALCNFVAGEACPILSGLVCSLVMSLHPVLGSNNSYPAVPAPSLVGQNCALMDATLPSRLFIDCSCMLWDNITVDYPGRYSDEQELHWLLLHVVGQYHRRLPWTLLWRAGTSLTAPGCFGTISQSVTLDATLPSRHFIDCSYKLWDNITVAVTLENTSKLNLRSISKYLYSTKLELVYRTHSEAVCVIQWCGGHVDKLWRILKDSAVI